MLRQLRFRVEVAYFCIWLLRLLFSDNLDLAFSTGFFVILQRFIQNLIYACDHVMQLELYWTKKIMQVKIVYLLIVVYVINFNFKSLRLLKEIINWDFGHKIGIQVVMDNLSLAYFDPKITLCFEEE